MTYIDDNPARNCPQFLILLHDSITSGFLVFKTADYVRLDCTYSSDCNTCPFAFRNSKFGCPAGGVSNQPLVDYMISCYPEYLV